MKAVVIGGGIIGSWTALHLAEAGVETTLIEQFPLPHSRGSSHGASRAFRFLGDDELDRLEYSLERWLELERLANTSLFLKTGLLNFGRADDPVLGEFMAVLQRGARPCEWLDSKAIRKRFPLLRYPDDWGAAWDPNGGILFAHRCLVAVQSRFTAQGGQILNARVDQLLPVEDGTVRLEVTAGVDGTVELPEYDRAIVCAGSWTAKLLPRLVGLLHCLLIPVTYWRDPSNQCSVSSGFPILFNARLTGIYALPGCEYPGLVKVLYHGGPEIDPDARDLAPVEPYVEKVSRYIEQYLPALDHRQPAIMESCMYTMSPDSQPILDRLAPNLVVGCGFSGSGFKYAPAAGKMLASLALGQEDALPAGFAIGRYTIDRFHDEDN